MMELLAPAGGYEALTAAVQNGADAVYMGFGAFNARRSAKNFTDEEFASAVRYCHLRGVRVFLTLNTLLTDRELPGAAAALRKASAMGVDAVLVQDWGLLTLAKEIVPDLPLHASTQMSLFTLGGANAAAALGMERVVLARELDRDEVREICAGCGAEIEVFGHGALCMCYSGQCEMSAVLGQRSGNRGACAQPCRLPYGVNGPCRGAYPLSLKDANLSAYLRDMASMGVTCLKLEGRLKRPEYVAVVTGIYRRLLDERRLPTAEESRALEQAFSRSGFTDGYWLGKKGKAMFGTRPENVPEPKALFARARETYENGKENRRIPVNLRLTVRRGEPVRLSGACAVPGGVTIVMATGDMPEEAERLTGGELASYEDKIRSALFKNRMQEEQVRGIMYWYRKPDSVNDKVHSVVFDVEQRHGRLWGVAECQISGELSAGELAALKKYISGQASDGWGEGFEQREIALDGGRELYVHLWQDEDWSIRTEQERFEPYRDKLPQLCFTLLPGTGQLICVKRGESGYYPSDWSTPDAQENRRIADEQNRKLGVTPAQEEAMKIGSMCGWDVPGADPDNCMDIAQQRGGMELG